jgi:hypothetical protein
MAALLWPFFVPGLDAAEPMLAADGDGAVYLAQNRTETYRVAENRPGSPDSRLLRRGASYVYRVDENGKISAAHRDDVEASGAETIESSRISAIASHGGNIYYIRETTGSRTRWTLVETDADLRNQREVFSGDYAVIKVITALSSDEGHIFLTGRSEDGASVRALAWTADAGEEVAGEPAVYAVGEAPEGDSVRAAVCAGGGSVYAAMQSGGVARFRNNEAIYLLDSGAGGALAAGEGRVAAVSGSGDGVYLETGALRMTPLDTGESLSENLPVRGVFPQAKSVWILAGGDGGTLVRAGGDGTFSEIAAPAVSLEAYLALRWFKSSLFNIPVLVLGGLLIVFALAALLCRRFFLCIAAGFSCAVLIFLAVSCAVVWRFVGKTDAELQLDALYSTFTFGGALAVLIIAAVCLCSLRGLSGIRDLTRQIKAFADGRFDVDGAPPGKGDIGEMRRTVTEMGVSLAIKQYEMNDMANSFYRFVPRGVERLLDRSSIMEIGSGDVTALKDDLCIVSVVNGEHVQKQTDSRTFMSFVNYCFSWIYSGVKTHKGMLLSGDFHLSALSVLFSSRAGSDAADGLRFGASLLGHGGAGIQGLPSPAFFLMMHHAEFLYGIAGTEDKAFPFIASSETGFLSTYAQKLHVLGIKMAATEQYIRKIAEDPACGGMERCSRYIGIISSDDGSHSYKLYELLNCHSNSERDLRLSYDGKLQEAIMLFYRNDFYLARTGFSSILKQNAGDGLARWYIFACEHFFDIGDLSGVNYNLFAIDEA